MRIMDVASNAFKIFIGTLMGLVGAVFVISTVLFVILSILRG